MTYESTLIDIARNTCIQMSLTDHGIDLQYFKTLVYYVAYHVCANSLQVLLSYGILSTKRLVVTRKPAAFPIGVLGSRLCQHTGRYVAQYARSRHPRSKSTTP